MSTTKRTDRMDIFIEEGRNIILIQEKWQYNWLTKVTPWTITEKRKFHELADQRIWKIWGGQFKLKVFGTSPFAIKHILTTFTVNFDIKWVLINPHWIVNVTKIVPGGFEVSYVDWTNKIISLDTEDTKIVIRNNGGIGYPQYPVAHEFGHAIGNVPFNGITHSDEYHNNDRLNGGFKLDYSSIMNIGNQLRNRHLDYILKELNSMFTNTYFYVI